MRKSDCFETLFAPTTVTELTGQKDASGLVLHFFCLPVGALGQQQRYQVNSIEMTVSRKLNLAGHNDLRHKVMRWQLF